MLGISNGPDNTGVKHHKGVWCRGNNQAGPFVVIVPKSLPSNMRFKPLG